MSMRARLMLVVAFVAALLGVVVSMVATPVLPSLVSGLVPALLEVPSGAVLVDGFGARVPVLESVTSGGLDVLRLPVLLPGVYFLWAPAGSLAGVLAPVSAPVTVVAGVGPAQLADPLGVPAVLLAVAAVALAAAAGRLTGWVSRLLLTGSLVGLACWAAWGHPDGLPVSGALVGVLALVSVVLAFLALPASRVRAVVLPGLVFVALGVAPFASLLVLVLLLALVLLRGRLLRRVVASLVGVAILASMAVAVVREPRVVDVPAVSAAECMEIASGGATPSASFALTSAEYADCWRALGVSLARDRSLSEASEALVKAIEGTGDVALASACHVAADAMAAQVTRQARDRGALADLASSVQSVCDFNGPHGFAIGAFVGVPADRWEELAVQVCGLPGPPELPELTWITQCWHGVGQAVARESGFDVAAVERVCALAPTHGDRSNCGEGLFADALDERVEHFDNVAGSHLAGLGTLPQMCASASDELSQGCFRYVGVEFGSGDKFWREIADGVQGVCDAQVPGSVKERQCWWGFGSVLASNPPVRDFDAAKEHVLSRCDQAPSVISRSGCVVRGLANLVSREVSEGRTIDVPPLCVHLSGPYRDTDCAGLVNLPNTITGKGHSF